MVGRRSRAGDALDTGVATAADRLRLFEQARHDIAQRGFGPRRLGGLPGDQTQDRHRHVGHQLGPDRLPDPRHRRGLDRGLIEHGSQALDPFGRAVVAFAEQQHVPVRGEILDGAGRNDFVGGKDHAADNALPRDRRAQLAARVEKREVRRRRMIRMQADIVPPGNAVLGEHDSGVFAEQRRKARDQAA